ncbi:hypothetical protein CRYUN_Cryun20dG0088700 [Craigia yunnanensis]
MVQFLRACLILKQLYCLKIRLKGRFHLFKPTKKAQETCSSLEWPKFYNPIRAWFRTNLTFLALAGNQLSGELPMSLSQLTKLTDLGLSDNFLIDEIPPSLISNWTNLISLQLQNNFFTGRIPPKIGLLTELRYLFFYNNELSGSIPSEIGNLNSMKTLDLSGNQLSGPIPPTIWSLSNLKGSIPRDFGKNSPQLYYVSFSNNSFFGELPTELCSGFTLENFTVNENNFTGSLPACLRNCTRLKRVSFDGNQFTGSITNAFGVHPDLNFIALRDNQFTGEISPEWGECQNLTNLQMDRNRISGGIPSELRKLSVIPQTLGNLVRLEYLDLSGNKLRGEITGEVENCEKLLSLNLSHNNLSGEIPQEIGSLSVLQYLMDFSGNSLSGSIPQVLGKLVSLENLNVSHNNLSNRISTSLSSMISLYSFDFSYNELTGPIPIGGVFQNAYGNAFVGNSATIATGVFIYHRQSKMLDEEIIGSKRTDVSEWTIWEGEGKFTFGDIEKATEGFADKYCIGKEGFGSVYRAVLPSGQVVAVKKLNLSDSSDIQVTNLMGFENEIHMSTEIRYQNIIKLYGYCSREDGIYLVYEYMERGSLGSVLYGSQRAVELGWATRVKSVLGLAHAIAYLHHDCSPPIIHRDITLNNILLEEEYETRLSDFGTARDYDGKAPRGALEFPVISNIVINQQRIASEGSGRTQACLDEPLGTITISKLAGFQK